MTLPARTVAASMMRFLRLAAYLLPVLARSGLAPLTGIPLVAPAVKPRASLRAALQRPGAPAGSISESSRAPRLNVPPVALSQMGLRSAEAKLGEILDISSPSLASMYLEADLLGLPEVGSGEMSLAALLDYLELTSPPPTSFDMRSLLGQWCLEYTNELPTSVREAVHPGVADLSVSLSINDATNMYTTAVITQVNGERKVVTLQRWMEQREGSPSFVSVSGESVDRTLLTITYVSKNFLVLRKMEADSWDRLPDSVGHSRVPSPKTEIWRKTSEAHARSVPMALWRFALSSGVSHGNDAQDALPRFFPVQNVRNLPSRNWSHSLDIRMIFNMSLLVASMIVLGSGIWRWIRSWKASSANGHGAQACWPPASSRMRNATSFMDWEATAAGVELSTQTFAVAALSSESVDSIAAKAKRAASGYAPNVLRPWSISSLHRSARLPRRATPEQMASEMATANPLDDFQGNQASLAISFFLFASSLPGVISQVNRAGQPKYGEKIYEIAGEKAGGLEMRNIARGVCGYLQSLNYSIVDSPDKTKIRFVGDKQGSLSQASFLSLTTGGALFAIGLVLSLLFPTGIFGLGGPNIWFLPTLASPGVGYYYWTRSFRKDILEFALEQSNDGTLLTLTALGDVEMIEGLAKGVRFKSDSGRIFRLDESGMEYQEGILPTGEEPQVY